MQVRDISGFRRDSPVLMSKLSLFIVIVVIAAVGAGTFFLLTWEIPPPTSKVEKVIPDERLPR